MKRKFYANLASSYEACRLTSRKCSKGHYLVENVRIIPEPYIVVPPYKYPPKQYRKSEEFLSEWCRECK